MADVVLSQPTFALGGSFNKVINSFLRGNQILSDFVELLSRKVAPGQLLKEEPVVIQIKELAAIVVVEALTGIRTVEFLKEISFH